ncbi:MAG: helix-turn-helix domain-containing protein, partial [Hyphomicrobiales bacterium]|nr:helix-turn-helix domain-containing protein [Hyphomicrobiales bacterium]
VCDLLDISTKTLRELGNSGKIVYRLKGTSWRCYAREDVEAFIGRISCQSTSPSEKTDRSKARTTNLISSSRSMENVVEFTAALVKQRREQQGFTRKKRKLALKPKDRSIT